MTDESSSDVTSAKPWWTVKQIADEFLVTERTVWRWIKEDRIVAHRFGGAVRIADKDRRTFIEAGRI